MKKLMLLVLALGLSMSVFAQESIKTSFQTTHMESASMNWSDTKEEWLFDGNDDLGPYDAFWVFKLNQGGCGGYIVSGDKIIYSVYDWEYTDNGVMVNFYSHALKEEGTVIIVVRDDNRNSMTFFLPETRRSITFHQSVKQ